MRKILISAGDASGDLHGAELVRALLRRLPDLQVVGMGGERMRSAGVEILVDQADLAVGGLVELLGSVGRIFGAWRKLSAVLRKEQFDLVVLIDSGGFNLPFARRVKRVKNVPILYYIAPQVWAWRSGRKKKLAARVDRLAVIHPFEVQVWQGSGVDAVFVGHPLVDQFTSYQEQVSTVEARQRVGVLEGPTYVALFPGSRRNEVQSHLPTQLEAVRELHSRDRRCQFILGLATSIDKEQVEAILEVANLPASVEMTLVQGRTMDVLRSSQVALVKPGTVTTEAMLMETPMVVMGKANPLTASVLKRALKIQWLAMPNLLAGRAIVPEFLQEKAQPVALAGALQSMLGGPSRKTQVEAFRLLKRSLSVDSSETASQIVEDMLESPST